MHYTSPEPEARTLQLLCCRILILEEDSNGEGIQAHLCRVTAAYASGYVNSWFLHLCFFLFLICSLILALRIWVSGSLQKKKEKTYFYHLCLSVHWCSFHYKQDELCSGLILSRFTLQLLNHLLLLCSNHSIRLLYRFSFSHYCISLQMKWHYVEQLECNNKEYVGPS